MPSHAKNVQLYKEDAPIFSKYSVEGQLDQMFSPIDWFTRLSYLFGYVFLTIISVGFGFGFYWKVLESRSEAARSAESAVGQVQSSLHGAATRLASPARQDGARRWLLRSGQPR